MTRSEENKARAQVVAQLRREGWQNIGPCQWQKDGETFDLDAAVMVEGRLRSAWAVYFEEMSNGHN